MNLKELQQRAHDLSRAKGWYDGAPLNIPEKLALIHSEISEALEDVRKPSAKLAELGIDVEEMVAIKHAYNQTRPYRHGGKAC